MANKKYIFDFDSTFIQCEAFDELHKYVQENRPEAQLLIDELSDVTERSMNGQLGFRESLDLKIQAAKLHQKDIEAVLNYLKEKVSPSFQRNRHFFEQNKDDIYIFSGGFIEFIWPIAKRFGLHYEHIFANRFLYDFEGHIFDFDRNNPLSHDKGKVIALQQLKLDGDIVVIGDGYNDYEMKEAGLAQTFFAYTENVTRDNVCKVADGVFEDLEGIFLALNIESRPSPKTKKVLLLENIHPVAIRHFESHGFEVEVQPHALDPETLTRALQGVSVLGIRSKTSIDEGILERANDLEAIGAFCIGTNQIDVPYCTEKGVAVFNAPFSNTRSVVELALGELLMLLRKIPEKTQAMAAGKWQKSAHGCYEARGKTLGIIGYGNIGSQLSVLAENLGMHVLFYDLEEKLPLGNARPCHSMDELLSASDVVTLHVDGRQSNEHLIDNKAIDKMKEGSYLLNLSRGHVIDLAALEHAIQSGKLYGAAVDVFPKEPESNQAPFEHTLAQYPQVMLTPHIGGSTKEAQSNIGQFVAHRLQEFSQLGSTMNCVNLPQLQLPPLQGSHRIIHTHKNVPGILANINSLFASYKINIVAQHLKTDEHLGYVITDVNELDGKDFITKLEAIEHTIRIKVLY